MPNGTYTDVDELPDLKSGSASAKQAVQYQSVDDLPDLKKKDGGQQSSTGSVNSNQASSSPSPAPSNSNQQEQPIPKYLVNIDGTTTPLHSDNEYPIPYIQQSIDQHNRQMNAGGSAAIGIPQKNVVPSSSDIEDKKKRAASVQIDANKAIDNTVKKMGAIQGIGGRTGIDEEFEKTRLQDQLERGEIGVGYDKDGNLGLKQKPTGFLDAFNKSYNSSREEALNADLFTNGSTTEERVAALKLKHDEENKDPFIGTKEDFGTSVGRVTGGAIEGLQKFGAGAMLGSAAVAAAPESAGTSLTGLPTALGVAMGSKDAFNIGYASEVERSYNAIKKQNPNISDIDAMKEAEKQGNVGGTIGLATNAALMGGGVESGGGIVKDAISDGAKNIIGDALKGTAKMSSLPAVGQAATEEIGNLQGVKTSQSDVINDAVQTFKNNLTPAVLLHLIGAGAAGLTQLPKPVENSLKFAATELNPAQIKATLEGGEKTGFYPAGTAELVTHDINNFKEATDKIPSDVPDDKKAEIAPLIQNKQALVEEQKTKDSSFKESYQNKIDAVDSQIKQIIERPKVEEPTEEVNNNSSPINTTENEQSSSKEANASSEGRQEVNQNEEAVQPEKETASSIDKDFTNGRNWEDLSSKEKVEVSKEYNKSNPRKSTEDQTNEFIKTLSDNGINKNDYSISKSSTNYGNSNYFEFHLPDDKPITVRVSDHSVTNPERMKELHYESLKMGDALKMKGDKLSDVINYIKENKESNGSDLFNDKGATKEGKDAFKDALEKGQPKSQQEINAIRKEVFGDEAYYDDKVTQSVKGISDSYMGKGVEKKPISDKIQPDDTFRTLDYGEHKGEEESKEKQDEIKQNILSDKPLGKTGEKFTDFVKRVVPAFKDLIDKEPNNTTVVTHSSVIKALDVWEDMGRPDIENMTDKQKQKFAEKYVKEDITKEGGVSTFKGEGDKVIHAIRHGETEDNKMSEFREDDTKLTDKGEKQAAKAGQELKQITGGEVPKIISSDLPRAVHTSNIISEQLGTEVPKEENATPKNKATLTVEKENPKPSSIEDDTTSIKNDVTEIRRKELGLKESEKTIKKAFGTTWEEAKDKLDKGYNPKDLIEELKKKPRPINDVESAVLLHEQNTKEIQMLETNKAINEAAEKGDKQGVEEAQVRKARLKDELQDIYDVDKASGRELGRGLSARNMMTDRKYNLVNMMAEKRAENGGEPLSEAQEKQVEALHQKIKETQQAYDDYVKQAEGEIKGLQEKILGKKVINTKTAAQKLRDIADNIDKKTKGQTYASIVPITPKMISNSMRLIATGLEKGEELLGLIKKAIAEIKGEHPDVDEKALNKAINKEVIDAGINSNAVDRGKMKDLSAIVTDRKALKLKADVERAKNDYELSLKKDSDKNLSAGAKFQNTFTKWSRAFKLSNPVTMGKLALAAITRMTTTPLEDIAGTLIHPLIPKISKGAIGEGGTLHVKELANSYKTGIIDGMKDSAKLLSKEGKGKTDIDVVFGKHADLPPEAIDFFGTLHSATKAPVKRMIFERSLQKRLRMSIANGIDVSDPLVQTRIALDSYKDATRAIFMQDNAVSKGWQKMTTYLDTPDAKTGKAPSKATATALKWLVPFVKVPTNISAEIGTNVYGVPVGVAKILHATFNGGMENLSADEKDVIMRNLKKGSLGAAALTLGYMNPKVFGGFYQPGEKRKDNDAEVGGVKIGDTKIPAWLFESPIFQAMQIGSTVRRVKDKMVHGEENGVGEGVWAGALGLVNHVPMVETPIELGKLWKSPADRTQYLGQLAKSTFDPALLNYAAMTTDPADKRDLGEKLIDPKSGTRKPSTIVENVETGIPLLRENVSTKKKQAGYGGGGSSGGY